MMKSQTLAALAAGIALTGGAFVLAIGAFDTNQAAARAADVDADLLNDARSNFQPLPKNMATLEFPITPSRVELGRKLFFDPRISVDGTVSCARCHQPALYGTDGLPKARGAHDKLNPRNVPTHSECRSSVQSALAGRSRECRGRGEAGADRSVQLHQSRLCERDGPHQGYSRLCRSIPEGVSRGSGPGHAG